MKTVWLVSFCLMLILLGCSTSNEPVRQETLLEVSATAGRTFYIKPETIKQWQTDDDITVLDVWVQLKYHDMPGMIAGEDQLWHIDRANRRYKISDSFAFDASGVYQET